MSEIIVAMKNRKNRQLIEQALEGEFDLRIATGELPLESSPDAFLLDTPTLKRHHRSIRRLKRKREPVFVPAMLLHNANRVGSVLDHLGETVDDLLRVPIKPGVLRSRLRNLLHTRSLSRELDELNTHLEEKVRQRTRTIREREEDIVHHLVTAVHHRDEETGNHIRRLGLYASTIADAMGWDAAASDDLQLAASLHDIGKIGIPDEILHKPDDLTEEEFEIIRQHPRIGASILENTQVPMLQLARTVALTHHERWDGSGYPRGLSGEDIPEAGRIVAVVDTYDALTNKRVYRDPLPEAQAVEIVVEDKGRAFDPRVVEAFLSVHELLKQKGEQYREPEEPTENLTAERL